MTAVSSSQQTTAPGAIRSHRRGAAYRVRGESSRHRRPRAAPQLAAPGGRARRDADGLPASGGAAASARSEAARASRGTRASSSRASRSTSRTRVRRCSPASATSGRCASGTGPGRRQTGASRRSGRWACSSPSDWKASWIEPDIPEDIKASGPSPMLRREFAVKGDVERARAYVTSHGLYEMAINGQRVGDAVLTPGWTSYNKRLQYQTYDVTPLLKQGPNAVGVTLGNGWYRGNLAWDDKRNIYGNRLGLLMQIVVTYRGGRQEIDRDRRELEGLDRPDPDVGDLPRRDLRRPPREAGLVVAGLRRPRLGGRQGRRAPQGHPRRPGRPAGPPDRRASSRSRSSRRRPATRSSTWARTWSAGSG